MIPPPSESYLEVKIIKVAVSIKVRQIWQTEYFFIMKLFPQIKKSTNVTETLHRCFLDCRQVFKEQVHVLLITEKNYMIMFRT